MTKICLVPDCYKKAKNKDRYCSMHRARLSRTGKFDRYMRSPIERLFEHVIKQESGCWEWHGGKSDRNGYGRIRIGDKKYLAHRVIYEYYYGTIPDGLLVCHKCDNPICVNPEHLFLGTNKDNAIDMCIKGRHHPMRGDHNGHAKLTQAQVNEIKLNYKIRIVSTRKLAKQYSVSQSCIMFIIRGRTWGHI